MSTLTASPAATSSPPQVSPLVMRVLGACALAHLINDLIQAVLPSIYPMLKANYGLSFTQVGLITLTFQLTASLLQPWIGYHTDRHPKPWLLPAGMVCTLIGILMLAFVGTFPAILLASALIGVGSSTFHPETSRVPAWLPAGATAWRNRPSRSAATLAARSAHCWRRRSSFPTARGISPGSACLRCSRSWCCMA